MKSQHNECPHLLVCFVKSYFLISCRSYVTYIREDTDSNVKGYDYTAYMDDMDPAVRCLIKAVNLIAHSLA